MLCLLNVSVAPPGYRAGRYVAWQSYGFIYIYFYYYYYFAFCDLQKQWRDGVFLVLPSDVVVLMRLVFYRSWYFTQETAKHSHLHLTCYVDWRND